MPWGLALCILILGLTRLATALALPDSALVNFVPDDAFYYLQFARNRIDRGLWSLDGTHPTTGFHLLHGYFLAGLSQLGLTSDWRLTLAIVGVLSSIALALSGWLATNIALRLMGMGAAAWAALPFVSFAALAQVTNVMESWLVTPLVAILVWLLTTSKDGIKANGLLAAFITGAGVLARTDFVIIPAVLVGTFLIGRSWLPNGWLSRAIWAMAGALIGVGLVAVHNVITAGRLGQASAEVKLHWSLSQGPSAENSFGFLLGILVPPDPRYALPLIAVLSIVVLLSSAYAVTSARRSESGGDRTTVILGLAVLAVLLAYGIFYAWNSGALATWYTAGLLVPVSLALAFIAWIYRRLRVPDLGWVLLPMALTYLVTSGAFTRPAYPHQTGMYNAAVALRSLDEPGPVGAWNAGILSFFSGARIVNIDGLANDSAANAVLSDSLPSYLLSERISRIVDFEEMVTSEVNQHRGGYSRAWVEKCLTVGPTLDGGVPSWTGSRLRLFMISPSC